jgi:antitoxin YefM
MDVISYSEARANMKKTMEKVCESRKPLLITRQGGEPVVMISLSEYESLDETAYLLSNPVNARRLRNSIEQLDRGEGVVRELIDCD